MVKKVSNTVKKLEKYTWATFKKELFKGKDIKEVQSYIVTAASAAGLLLKSSKSFRPSNLSQKLSHLNLEERKNILATMYVHTVKGFIPGDTFPNTRKQQIKWGVGFEGKVQPVIVTGEGTPAYGVTFKRYGFTDSTSLITKSPLFVEQMRLSIQAMHTVGVRKMTDFVTINLALSVLELLNQKAQDVLDETQEKQVKYFSDDVDDSETIVHPYKLLNRINEALKLINNIRNNLEGEARNKLELINSNYERIKNEIDEVYRTKPKTETGYLIFAEVEFERLRKGWETLASSSLSLVPEVSKEIHKKLREMSKNNEH